MTRYGFLIALLASTSIAFAANSKISEHAVYPITKKGYPKLYAQWGAKKINEVNALMPLAAAKVAASPECNKVDLVELSSQRSSPTGDIVFFADCQNGKRFYVSKAELTMKSGAPQSQEAKMRAVTDQQAIAACDRAIKAQLTNPMTFDKKFGSNSVYRAPSTGNIAVEFTFEAKNNFGGALPHKARCVINDKGLQDAIITK